MVTIKIISNPYEKKISFEKFDDISEEWIPITIEKNPNSKLLKKDITDKFLPFILKAIIDILQEEYVIGDEKLKLVFEGTTDEYDEMASFCSDGKYKGKVVLERSDIYLENARDILPAIIDVFKNVSPLIAKNVNENKTRKEFDKFADASNDDIPICVLGNYSSGKSTFINALIGKEILPSGDTPTTSRIYRIKKSPQVDRALIRFKYDNTVFSVDFKGDVHLLEITDKPLASKIEEALEECENDIPVKITETLKVINDFDTKEGKKTISDLVEIRVPFGEGLLKNAQHSFVIFDTPGSNSVSNEKHLEVLRNAIRDMSNGIPVYVSEFDALDSTDNNKLLSDIKEIAELDDRFSMIIVNKADSAHLPKHGFNKEKEKELLNQTIPRQFYSGGIYFISSIMGLGSKTKGEFEDDYYDEVYYDQERKYSDPESKRYKKLYSYNIMPEQIKQKVVEESEKENDLIYANSGLYCVEKEIEKFADKYSSYDKCVQSESLLSKVIKITNSEIEERVKKCNDYKTYIQKEMERGQSELVNDLNKEGKELKRAFIDGYNKYMKPIEKEVESDISLKHIRKKESEFIETQKDKHELDEKKRKIFEALDDTGRDLADDIKLAARSINKKHFEEIGRSLQKGMKAFKDNINDRDNARRKADKEAAEMLLEYVRDDFKQKAKEAHCKLDEASKSYWEEKADEMREKLAQIVMGHSALEETKKNELKEFILQYKDIEFEDHADEFFNDKFLKMNVAKKIRMWNEYKVRMSDSINKSKHRIKPSHKESFEHWLENLLSEVIQNITKYNPDLNRQAKIVTEETARISEMEADRRKLELYTEQIKDMMGWK